ncbi:unnamed protein product [Lepeophtheirus salmonis]|uniref:(salmon louse) hypothetical protein n=1 Tax=Lepeophtheirus salmonis TaxID=72036 RepID=A0A7R8CNI6_LEPSM|nr:unnamed protein product [Lepeophtheirus salmonis]CAF2875703.1 unnamed protein product [Lepeophtheirus salmonis]
MQIRRCANQAKQNWDMPSRKMSQRPPRNRINPTGSGWKCSARYSKVAKKIVHIGQFWICTQSISEEKVTIFKKVWETQTLKSFQPYAKDINKDVVVIAAGTNILIHPATKRTKKQEVQHKGLGSLMFRLMKILLHNYDGRGYWMMEDLRYHQFMKAPMTSKTTINPQ